jgi:hypothetical protein
MEKDLTSMFMTTLNAPTDAIVSYRPNINIDATNCEQTLQIGFFFDGTDNNKDRDIAAFGDSNVVRLWQTYQEEIGNGVHKLYVPGVGTPFPEIGEMGSSTFGTAFGSGCFARIIYGFLWFFNEINIQLGGKEIFESSDIKKIVSRELSSDNDHMGRRSLLLQQIKKIEDAHKSSQVKLREVFVDIFGFSRGAAEARVFSTWLLDLLQDGKFGGIPLTIRFLGIFDTVASAGTMGSIGNTVINSTGGHAGWAEAKFLRIRKEVKNCVHMVAMHEVRKNFPLDEVSVAGSIPPNCQEYAYPGGHSDVGGGYKPGQLGIAGGDTLDDGDKRKLSQIPLRHMLDCAIAAGAPMIWEKKAQLEINIDVEKAYIGFLNASTDRRRKLSEWMLPYLAWRLQVCKQYSNLEHVQRANSKDKEFLVGGNSKLISDANHIRLKGDSENSSEFVRLARKIKNFDLKKTEYRQDEISYLDPEAPDILAQAQAHPPISHELAHFFDTYVHDSLAGFRKDLKEPTGYWRVRRSFRGGDLPELAKKQLLDKSSRTA